jgi:hypothetical protein
VKAGADIVPIVILDSQVTFEARNVSQAVSPEVSLKILPAISTAGRDKSEIPALVSELEALMNTTLAAERKTSWPGAEQFPDEGVRTLSSPSESEGALS